MQRKEDKTHVRIYPQSEVDALIKEVEAAYPKVSDSLKSSEANLRGAEKK